ncbi:hypothetical protein I4U23_009070 [Adineta vaga]|nr:hypothetical protein I4U23_009070 [Adineta vaga]
MFNQSHRRLFYFLKFCFILHLTQSETFKCVKDGFFPDKKDCWIYHICVGSSHSVKACKEDLLFNPEKNECDWAMNVNCTKRSYDDTLPGTVPTHIFYPPDYIYATPSSSYTGDNINRGKNPSRYSGTSEFIFEYLCRSVDNDFIAHPTDCKRYAYCANGVPQPKNCTKSLFWSQKEKMCVWPVQSDCPEKNTYLEYPDRPTRIDSWIPRGLTDKPRVTPMSHVFQARVECPSMQPGRVPDPFDCSLYHECLQGTAMVTFCPAQLLYNRETQNCDYPQEVQCKNRCTQHNEGARFVDLTSCCHFYECVSGKLIPQTCTHPNSFDIQTRTCLPYKRVKCDGRRQCLSKCHYLSNYDVGKSLCDFIPSCAGHSDGFYLDRTKPNCQSYIQCIDNRVVNHSRCTHGLRFNRNIGRCAPADQVPCRAPFNMPISSFYLTFLFILLVASKTVL